MLHQYTRREPRLILETITHVSLTSQICKTLEHILVSQIIKHLETNDILMDVQYGFKGMRSCESQLFLTIDDFARAVDNKLQVDVAILGFQ